MMAHAMVLKAFNKPLEMQEFPLPPLKPGEVLVRLAASGVCGSDVHMLRGHDPRTPLPIILGHESIGVVEQTGSPRRDMNGDAVNQGDLIGWDRGVVCDECFFCSLKKKPYLCPNRRVYGISISCKEAPHLKGGYATHMVLDAKTKLLKLPPDAVPEVLVSASCSGATAAHAVEQCGIRQGDTVAVIGTGSLGLFALAFVLNRGATQVVAVDVDEPRLALARLFGANHTLNVRETSPEQRMELVKSITHGRGADVVIDCSGYAPGIKDGMRMCCRGGTYTMPGIAVPVGETPVSFYEEVSIRNLVIRGVWVSDSSHYRQAVELILSKRYPFDRLVNRTFHLEEANEALGATERREVVKAVIKPEK